MKLAFGTGEIQNLLKYMLQYFDSRAADVRNQSEAVNISSFFRTYVKLAISVSIKEKEIRAAIEQLINQGRKEMFDEVFERDLHSLDVYKEFYSQLCQYYLNDNESDAEKLRDCHQNLLWKFHDQLHNCHPYCDYLDIHLAYVVLGEDDNAQQFLVLAERHTSVQSLFTEYTNAQMQKSQDLAQISEIHVSKVLRYLKFIQEGRLSRNFSEVFSAVDLFKRKGEMEHAKKVEVTIVNPTYSVYKHSQDIKWLITTAHTCLEEGALHCASTLVQHAHGIISGPSVQNVTLVEAAYIAGNAFFKAGNKSSARKWLNITVSLDGSAISYSQSL